jgi:hypothetical protein
MIMVLSGYGLDLQFASNQSLFEDSTTIEILFTNPNTCDTTILCHHDNSINGSFPDLGQMDLLHRGPADAC